MKSQYHEAGKSVQVLCGGSGKSTVLVSYKQSRIPTVHANKFRPVPFSYLYFSNEVNLAISLHSYFYLCIFAITNRLSYNALNYCYGFVNEHLTIDWSLQLMNNIKERRISLWCLINLISHKLGLTE